LINLTHFWQCKLANAYQHNAWWADKQTW